MYTVPRAIKSLCRNQCPHEAQEPPEQPEQPPEEAAPPAPLPPDAQLRQGREIIFSVLAEWQYGHTGSLSSNTTSSNSRRQLLQ